MQIDYRVTRAYNKAIAEKANEDQEMFSKKRRAFHRMLNDQYRSQQTRFDIMVQLESEFGSLLSWK